MNYPTDLKTFLDWFDETYKPLTFSPLSILHPLTGKTWREVSVVVCEYLSEDKLKTAKEEKSLYKYLEAKKLQMFTKLCKRIQKKIEIPAGGHLTIIGRPMLDFEPIPGRLGFCLRFYCVCSKPVVLTAGVRGGPENFKGYA